MRISGAKLAPVTAEHVLLRKRQALRESVWGGQGSSPGGTADVVDTNGSWITPIMGTTNISRVDRLRFNLPWGLWAYVYHCVPAVQAATRRCMILHQGHDGWSGGGISAAATYFLGLGYDVMIMAMPCWDPNPPLGAIIANAITITLENGVSTLSYYDHDNSIATLGARGTERTNPLRLYLDPPIRTINYAIDRLGIPGRRIFMAGLSGGGWTTHLVGVLDDRPAGLYPVAGFMPHDSGEPTDYEQASTRPIYTISAVREMFAIAGLRRRHVQCLNNLDAYFRYANNATFPARTAYVDAYKATVQSSLLNNTIGYFTVRVDTTQAEGVHAMSANATAFMASDIATYIT